MTASHLSPAEIDALTLPSFDALTLDPAGPPGNIWGLYGSADELGMLNLLTPSTVAAAAREEIRTGVRVSLDLPLNVPPRPCFGRQEFSHEVRHRGQGRVVNDDVLCFNTQASTQWDGFRHCGNHKLQRFYMNHTQEEVHNTTVLGTDAWLRNGGIQGRGILIDWASWKTARGDTLPDPFSSTPVPLAEVQQILAETHVTPRRGDILFLRTGVDAAIKALSETASAELAARPEPNFLGLEAGEDTLRWLWSCGFAAVASDCPSFERAPVAGPHADLEHTLHQWCLAAWGMPIGELFDLEEVAGRCKEDGRWSFFVSSVPLKVPGGVASPPNAVAIF
ncbi:uncharacterized protein K452DRAFT_359266 [Aplosporella prunicola CBS 121167]|uniref:Cyclase n=1 Tax=Aplosporella prunicola CBS 121167 TaxID=1176127 RepID=A0A6A6BE97_9PEZI|nr:uncharacterized protein K452DRAFT_359266 [Aplosporella prunicola CBS 121167]KAF2140811.1 hypothetical protein K452DRAFT_359266 [Aplosporella prunicola CBS 121167]